MRVVSTRAAIVWGLRYPVCKCICPHSEVLLTRSLRCLLRSPNAPPLPCDHEVCAPLRPAVTEHVSPSVTAAVCAPPPRCEVTWRTVLAISVIRGGVEVGVGVSSQTV